MKQLTLLIILVAVCTITKAQSGQGYKFSYDAAGYRIKRAFHTNSNPVPYLKQGKEQETDTLIWAIKEDNNLSEKQQVIVKSYPNPVKSTLFIENFSWTEGAIASISVFDVTGKKVFTSTANTAKKDISLQALAPGSYQVNYKVTNQKPFIWKIIKL